MKSFSEYLENIDESSKNNYSLSNINKLLNKVYSDWHAGLVNAKPADNGYMTLSYKSGKANIIIDAKEPYFSYVEKSGKTVEYIASEHSDKIINGLIKHFYIDVHKSYNKAYHEKLDKLDNFKPLHSKYAKILQGKWN